MKNILKTIGALIIVVGLLGSSAALQAFAAVHTLQFVETPSVALYSSQSTTATTMVITPVPTDLQGNTLTMASFGSSPTVTVDPGILSAEEIESFTSFTNNGNNTATLGGITRNLQSVYPYGVAGANLITHGAGAIVVFSNNPQLYNRLASWENDGSIAGTWSFVTQPVYNTTQVFTNPLALINKAYADGLSIQGAPTSTFNGMGVVQLATNAQISAGTASSTTGAPLVIPAKAASSTYNGATAFQGEISALRSTKDIDPNFIATSTGNNYVWGGTHTFNATTTMATSTVASTTITTGNIITANINTLNLVGGIKPLRYTLSSSFDAFSGAGSITATSSTLNIPAGLLTASSSITITATANTNHGSTGGAANTFFLKTATGVTIASCSDGQTGASANWNALLNISLVFNNALNSQTIVMQCASTNATSGNVNQIFGSTQTSSIDMSQAFGLVMVGKSGVANDEIKASFNMVVNP